MAANTSKVTGKRVSAAQSAPKAPTALDPTAIIAQHALLTGTYPITIGPRAVIHPYAKIISSGGPVIIQEGAIVWEKAIIGASGSTVSYHGPHGDVAEDMAVKIGRNAVIETGAIVEAEIVGEGTLVEAFARVGQGANIGKVC